MSLDACRARKTRDRHRGRTSGVTTTGWSTSPRRTSVHYLVSTR